MKTFSITYDLLKPGQDYADLIARLQALGAIRIELSQWLLSTNQGWSAEAVRNDLARFIDANDCIMVAVLSGEAAWQNLLTTNDKVKQSFAA